MELTDHQRELITLASGLRRALAELGDRLRNRQFEAEIDLLEPAVGEVKLGLASHQFRLLAAIAQNPMLWAHPHVDPFLRAMVETRILSAWLISRDDSGLYKRFVEFGQGRLKLQKLHLEDFIDSERLGDNLDEALEQLGARVNEEVLEEFQSIDLGSSFAGITRRKMAEEVGLTRLYNLDFQPLSAESHAEWDSLLEWDLARSPDPLHQGHRFGTFEVPEDDWDLSIVGHAYSLALGTIPEIFESLGLDVTENFETCAGAISSALRAAKTPAP
jgi:hypothetical protein